MRALLRRLGEEHAAVGEDPDGVTLDPREAADERVAVERLELVEAAAVDDARDHLERVELVAEVLGDEAVEVGRVDGGRLGRRDLPGARLGVAEVTDDLARDRERVLVGGREVVGHTGAPGVDVRAAELLRRHVLAGGCLHQRRAADEDRAGALHDHRLVRHRRHVGATRGARAHHDRDLRDALRRQPRLVVEDPPEVLPVGEHVRLEREERPTRVDEVHAREPVLLCHLLRAEVLLHRERVVRAALDGRVVRDDDAVPPFDHADPGDDPGGRGVAVVELPGGERVQLEEGGAGVDETVDPLAGGELAPRAVPLERLLAAAAGHERGALAQLGDEPFHACAAPLEGLVAHDVRGEDAHGRSLSRLLAAGLDAASAERATMTADEDESHCSAPAAGGRRLSARPGVTRAASRPARRLGRWSTSS